MLSRPRQGCCYPRTVHSKLLVLVLSGTLTLAADSACSTVPGHCAGGKLAKHKVKRPIYDGLQHPMVAFECCGGAVKCGGSGCELVGPVTVDFYKLNAFVSDPASAQAAGALGLGCESPCPLEPLESPGRPQFHMKQLLQTIGLRSAAASVVADQSGGTESGTLVLVRRDVDNLWHQMGSVVSTFEHLVLAQGGNVTIDRAGTDIAFIDTQQGHLTGPLWSPGLAGYARPTTEYNPSKRVYARVLLPMFSGAHWWWRSSQTRSLDLVNRQPLLDAFSSTVLAGLRMSSKPAAEQITLLSRAGGSRGRGWPDVEAVQAAIQRLMPAQQVEIVEFSSAMPWTDQLERVRRTKLLVSTHGAGLTWGLLLPHGAGVLELLGAGQETQGFFMAMCAWQGRSYRRHQPQALSHSDWDWTGDFKEDPNVVAKLVADFMSQLKGVNFHM